MEGQPFGGPRRIPGPIDIHMSANSSPNQEEWTIARLLNWTKGHFEARSLDEPRLAAELLLAQALGCKRIELYARFGEAPTESQRAAFRELVKAAAGHKPIAYLTGRREFYSLEFVVTPDVLIPRPETELLVELALDWCKQNAKERYELLDLGTGSGCVAVTVVKRQGGVHALATDVSEAALEVAARNAERHAVTDRIRFVRADMLGLPAEVVPAGGFDMIVSNPPYIAETEREALPANIRDHEPAVALFGGDDGLQSYRRISEGVHRLLRPGGMLAMEVGYEQAAAVEAIFAAGAPGLHFLARHRDLAGIDRAIQFTLPG